MKSNKTIKITEKQQEVLDVYEEYNYRITMREAAEILGVSYQVVGERQKALKKKGIDIQKRCMERRQIDKRVKLQEEKDKKIRPLTETEYNALDFFEEKGYLLNYQDTRHLKIYPSTIQRLIQRFSVNKMDEVDALKISKLIINRTKLIKNVNNLRQVLTNIEGSEEIAYDNIKILIDELLNEPDEDKTRAIEFIIKYEEILINRGMERVEEPIYQLLMKYNIQLNKKQCNRLLELLNVYEERIKPNEIDDELEL